ncbi:MAG: flavodoxin family protein [Nocardioidaceae bacterium]
MRAIVVYESMFGNTERVAQAIGEGLAPYGEVHVVEVGEAPTDLGEVDLVVVGGPTHAFGMSRPSTREDAQRQAAAPVVSSRCGIREWIGLLADHADVGPAVPVATFDTKVRKARRLPGAARATAKALHAVGHRTVADPESFYVADTPGPLQNGELDRAFRWGNLLGRKEGTVGQTREAERR